MAPKRHTPRQMASYHVHSRAQQGFLFATHKPWAKRWSRRVGETGPRGNPASRAVYHRLPIRTSLRKKR
ncbi:MAG TPA: hypothetical protein VHB02_06115 [Acidimicrobiales bacterium]|nr:hypothetical protein [Acidimicrobiales bacterium]